MQRILLFFSFILFFTPLFSWDTNITSIEANFLQVTYQGEEKITYSGILYAKTPNFAKWVYQNPLKKEIYLNGNEVAIYEPMLEQVTLSTLTQKNDFFTILHAAKLGEDGNYHAIIANTHYTLILKNNIPYQIHFVDELQNTIKITLKNVKTNITIPDNTFIFTPPPHIDIIKQ
ncbi:LolA-like outer membrane lipoprotein chaperone [Helicobacter anatolicus]|uniref:LolA-like outer membrane lipoprotein chaperone n=1 Tax=Helicobacter anatolicus TaxID=2905874 RepID=UPI001E33116C|nr:LolA-like outer membrane lipoprotein chaperone [Helicobacter anatolicus]MCE3040406.1 LolA-like outer membrane lipoprotein chaperone [Helicobacter anatolicus]